jgi:hypothetical protein
MLLLICLRFVCRRIESIPLQTSGNATSPIGVGQAASVATLPSALLCERFSLGASWVFSIQSFGACGPRKLMKIT